EVREAVDQDSRTTQQGNEGHGSINVRGPMSKFAQAIAVNEHEKPNHRQNAQAASFGQQLDVVVVCLIDVLIREKASELRVHHGEGPQSPTQNRLLGEHLQAVAVDCQAYSSRQFSLGDRKSTRLNSSHQIISYAVFC